MELSNASKGRKRLSRKERKLQKSSKAAVEEERKVKSDSGRCKTDDERCKASKRALQVDAPKPNKKKRSKKQAPEEASAASALATGPTAASGMSASATAVLCRLKDPSSVGSLSDWLNPTHPSFDAALKGQWKSLSKRERTAIVDLDKARVKQAAQEATVDIAHPFEVDEDDHCETSGEAYADILSLLELLCEKLGKTQSTLRVFDPFYCAGAVIQHLAKLGFTSVYNKCEDFYLVQQEGRIPEHDVVVTNPPYSGDHVERLLRWCRLNGRPFLLLMPNYFCKKPYYESALGGSEHAAKMLYLFPAKRYSYWTPRGLRVKSKVQTQHVSAAGHRTSPFVSLWYINLAPVMSAKRLLHWWKAAKAQEGEPAKAIHARLCSLQDLPTSAWS
mmetsp:Transcript_30471/g.67026  ORF Transcript_30471/g.67026 Transcript_30471/m.67026 type:complete len:389 (+) Transcript_30471:88-1254(+)